MDSPDINVLRASIIAGERWPTIGRRRIPPFLKRNIQIPNLLQQMRIGLLRCAGRIEITIYPRVERSQESILAKV
jgi:hypothetical protein